MYLLSTYLHAYHTYILFPSSLQILIPKKKEETKDIPPRSFLLSYNNPIPQYPPNKVNTYQLILLSPPSPP